MPEPEPDEPNPTVLDRLRSAGISEDRARGHLEAGRILLDGQAVTDPSTPAPHGTRLVAAAP